MEPQPLDLMSVLVVEDDPATQRRMRAVLASVIPADACVRVAADLATARAWLTDAGFSLALVDVQLPDGNGIDLIRWMARHAPGVPAVIVSAWASEDTIIAAVQAGAIGYLLKNSDDDELRMSLRSLQRGGAPIDPVIARRILELMPRMTPVAAAPAAAIEPEVRLSPRETEVLTLVAHGLSNREIAQAIALSRLTIECHTKNIYRKLAVGSRTEAVFEARAKGLLQ